MATLASVGTSDAQMLTVGNDVLSPGSETWVVLKATVNNQTGAAHAFTGYRVPAGGTNAASNAIIYALSVPAGETLALPISGQAFEQNQIFRVIATATGVLNINVSYAVLS